jgi:hypothetical protein
MHREHTEHMHATHTAHTHSCPLVPAEDRFQNPTNTGNARLLESLTLNGVEFAWNYNPLYTLNHLCSTCSTCLVSNRHARLTLCRRFLAEAWLPSPLLLLSFLSVCHVCVPFQARALLLLTAGLPPAQACRSSFGHQVVLHTVPCSWHPPCLLEGGPGSHLPAKEGPFLAPQCSSASETRKVTVLSCGDGPRMAFSRLDLCSIPKCHPLPLAREHQEGLLSARCYAGCCSPAKCHGSHL